jgi:hypothetical protein
MFLGVITYNGTFNTYYEIEWLRAAEGRPNNDTNVSVGNH